MTIRKTLTDRYIKDRHKGIEIAPFHNPWPVPPGIDITYVDRYSRDELISQHPEIEASKIVETGLICDGRYLDPYDNNHLDFIINSHVFEHLDNPVMTLIRWLEVLKLGRHLIMAIPDMRQTFDRGRTLTNIDDLWKAFKDAIFHREWKMNKFREWYTVADPKPKEIIDELISVSMEDDAHIHFTVWTPSLFVSFLDSFTAKGYGCFEMSAMIPSGHEFFVVLTKSKYVTHSPAGMML